MSENVILCANSMITHIIHRAVSGDENFMTILTIIKTHHLTQRQRIIALKFIFCHVTTVNDLCVRATIYFDHFVENNLP